jgi:hypothetical protein
LCVGVFDRNLGIGSQSKESTFKRGLLALLDNQQIRISMSSNCERREALGASFSVVFLVKKSSESRSFFSRERPKELPLKQKPHWAANP